MQGDQSIRIGSFAGAAEMAGNTGLDQVQDTKKLVDQPTGFHDQLPGARTDYVANQIRLAQTSSKELEKSGILPCFGVHDGQAIGGLTSEDGDNRPAVKLELPGSKKEYTEPQKQEAPISQERLKELGIHKDMSPEELKAAEFRLALLAEGVNQGSEADRKQLGELAKALKQTGNLDNVLNLTNDDYQQHGFSDGTHDQLQHYSVSKNKDGSLSFNLGGHGFDIQV
jgi:hypothetical protein